MSLTLTPKTKQIIDNTFLKNLTPKHLEEKLAEAYLGILVNDNTIFNPLANMPLAAHKQLPEYILYLMGQPDYFYFLMKQVLQIDSYPQQCLIIKELFQYRFPLLLGCRGMSKCLVSDTYIVSDGGIKQVKDFNIKNIPYIQQDIGDISLYGENAYNKIEYGFYSGKRKTRIITTRSGRRIECTLNHPLRAVSNNSINWVDSENLEVGNYLVVQRKYDQWANATNIDVDIAYMIGAMVGDGCYSDSSGSLGFTNVDEDCLLNVNIGLNKWLNGSLNLINDGKGFHYSVKSECLQNKEIKSRFINDFGAKPYSISSYKITPKSIMSADFNSIAAYLQGLFDTDGSCITNMPIVEFSTKSKQLAEETQLLLLLLGINANLKKQFNVKYNRNYFKLQISGSSLRVFRDKVGFRIFRKQSLLIKHCYKKINDNIDIIPKELVINNLIAVRELARDTVYKTKSDIDGAQTINISRLKKYDMSYVKFKEVLNKFQQSENARSSNEFKVLKEIYDNNYYYDQIVSIQDGESDTYDVHLCGDDHSFISNGLISHNSFSLAVYIFLRMILIPDTKCIITAAGFRQAKVIFDYMETIWSKSEMLRNCFRGDKNGPKHGTDVWTFRLGNSVTYALPVGPDGSKVRGYRANCVDGRTLIQTDKGLIKIKDYKDYHIFNINGAPELPSSHYQTEPTDVYELTTELGYTLRFSKVHQLYINRDGVDQWAEAKDIMSSDYVYLDNNDYFPSQTVTHNGIDLTESHILYSGLINLSSLSAPEVPWYILQSPRRIVQSYLRVLFGPIWLSKIYRSPHKYKVEQIQQLLLKFNFISSVNFIKGEYILQVVGQHRDLGRPTDKVKSVIKLDKQDNLYDFVLDETHSFLGGGFVNHNCLINDEFATANRQVFEEVMSGFLSVASSPIEQVKLVAQQEIYKTLYIPIPKSNDQDGIQNQLILSGTAYYRMNHFYSYFLKWREIIKSKNDPRILNSLFENPEDREGINPDDYCTIRIPLSLVAGGYMDMAQINRIKASTTKDVYLREYCSCFTNDSDGFFKKQLIDSCTIQDESDPAMFTPRLYGNKGRKHIFGIDPAYEGDNFAIVVLELDGPTRRVVYTWTTQASDHKERLKEGVISEQDYFHYCARKIRDLMKRFPCEYIAMDPLGGGRAVIEAFMDTSKLSEGELAILPTIEPDEETKETDLMKGLHIIKIINFTSDWIAQANYGLKKDMEDKSIMFPFCDDVVHVLAEAYDESMGENKTLWDTLDDCILEIDELKKELITITVTETATGRERFDTPTTKVGINRKGRLKKDRYSALLLANWVGRSLSADYCKFENPDLVNLAGFCTSTDAKGLFFGNNKTASKLEELYRDL